MKNYPVITAFLLTAVLVTGLAGCSGSPTSANPATGAAPGSVSQAAGDSSTTTGIWVSGTGKVTVTPDIAIVNLGVSDQEPTVAAAQANTTDAMNKVIAALKQNGLADKDIQTTNYSIQQVTKYDSTRNESVVTGYMVSNMVTAKIRALDKVGAIIDAVAAAGGDSTRINGISLTVENPQNYYGQARTLAVADAKAKADQLASLAGIKVGAVVYITESSGYNPTPVPIVSGAAGAPQATTPISAGQTDITLSVQVAYAISQ